MFYTHIHTQGLIIVYKRKPIIYFCFAESSDNWDAHTNRSWEENKGQVSTGLFTHHRLKLEQKCTYLIII